MINPKHRRVLLAIYAVKVVALLAILALMIADRLNNPRFTPRGHAGSCWTAKDGGGKGDPCDANIGKPIINGETQR